MRRMCILAFLPWCWACATTAPPVPAPPPPAPEVPALAPEAPAADVLPQPEPEPAPAPAEPVFQVTPEKKSETLDQVKTLVARLDTLIARQAYPEWRAFLDEAYVKLYSSPEKLADITARDPALKARGLRLKNLEDFFRLEVVPSRAEVTVADITFLDSDRVQVWTDLDGERFLLYLLKFTGNEWKISTW